MSAGEQLRDYLPVNELASHLVALAMRRPDAGVVNVCSGRPVSVRSLVERWVQENGWEIALELGYYPYPDYEPMAFWGCDGRLNQLVDQRRAHANSSASSAFQSCKTRSMRLARKRSPRQPQT
jgi:dTDP-6-deoxy-L-talose 4-dehydrogenase (NAD+)